MIQALEKFGRLRRQLSQAFIAYLKPVGVAPRQAILLRYLSVNGASSLADLSRLTVTDPATVTRAMRPLRARGWLRQAAHPTDHRRLEVSLTPSGRKVAGAVEKVYAKTADRLVAPLTAPERETLLRLLDKILASGPAGGPRKERP